MTESFGNGAGGFAEEHRLLRPAEQAYPDSAEPHENEAASAGLGQAATFKMLSNAPLGSLQRVSLAQNLAGQTSNGQLQRMLAGLKPAANPAVLQRIGGWSDADSTAYPAPAAPTPATPAGGWNAGEQAVGTTRRIPVEGLSEGNQGVDKAGSTKEGADGRAIAIVPSTMKDPANIQVLLHFHGHNVGYRERSKKGDLDGADPGGMDPGTVRDVAVDKIEQQMAATGRPMIGILAQLTSSSGVVDATGKARAIDSDKYIGEVLVKLQKMLGWASVPGVASVMLAAHSGGGARISDLVSGKTGNSLPQKLGEIALFDAINDANQLNNITNWVTSHIKDDLSKLKGQAVPDQLAYLDRGMKFRAYYTASEFYQPSHQTLQASIDALTKNSKIAKTSLTQPVLDKLIDNYKTIPIGEGHHNAIMGRPDKKSGKGRLETAINDLPPITTPATATPVTTP